MQALTPRFAGWSPIHAGWSWTSLRWREDENCTENRLPRKGGRPDADQALKV
jgi:hypothetical protein